MRLPKLLLKTAAITSAIALQLPTLVIAAPASSDALEFHELLRSSVPEKLRDEKSLSMIHMLPDAAMMAALSAPTADAAIKLASQTSLERLARSTVTPAESATLDADAILAETPITLVIVPGIFGELIPNRPFEDVLMKPSPERDAFQAQVRAAALKGDPNATDSSYNMAENATKSMRLDELVNVGSLTGKDGKTLARVVLLYTPFMSLESMGNLEKHAEIFNRRLSKYLAISGSQKLALVGYSRGTVLGLEMLSQAKQKNLSWLGDVKSLIGLGGVIWGSTLADNTLDASSPMSQAVTALKTLSAEMDANSARRTLAAWGRFSLKLARIAPRLTVHENAPTTKDLKASPLGIGLDVMSVVRLTKLVYEHLGLNKPFSKFSDNVQRFQKFVAEALGGVESLTSSAREQWWKTHTLPKSVSYISMTAAMANPEAGAFDLSAFDGEYGYSKRSYDDLSLLQNRLDYESASGLALNDSQVSIPQAAFLPNAIARLNPANAGLRTSFIGTAGTHHWGLALRVVNVMKDGRMNPFPREALLKALAAKAVLDYRDSAGQTTERVGP